MTKDVSLAPLRSTADIDVWAGAMLSNESSANRARDWKNTTTATSVPRLPTSR